MELMNQHTLSQLVNELSIEFFGKPFTDKVKFNNRLRTTGGRYIPAKRLIEINPKYAIEMEGELEGIIKHELCHYHLHITGMGYKHGDPEFKRLLKITGSPRHCRPLHSEKDKFKYLYKCIKCGLIYKRKRRVNVDKYKCGKCRGKLLIIEER